MIGFSVYDMKFDFFQEMEMGTRTHLKELGYDLIVFDQKSSTERQLAGCQELINKGVKVLIVSPINSTVMDQIVNEAHAKNIPVIVNDIGAENSAYDAFVVADCIGGGRMAGEYLYNLFASEKKNSDIHVISFRNSPQVAAAYSRADGFLEIANEFGWHIIADEVADGEKEAATMLMKKLLEENSVIDAVFCTNDPMALGVLQACKEAKRENIKVIGFNGDIAALKAIREGEMTATIQQYPYAMGEIAADIADMLIKKTPVEFDIPQTKTILIPVTLIDKQNVEDAFKALH